MIRLRINELAAARGMTYRALAQHSGLSERHLRRLRQGTVTHVGLHTMYRLCDALGVENVGDLIQLDREQELKECYTIAEVAELFKVPMDTIFNELGRGELHGTKVQGHVAISRQAVEDYVRRHTVPAPQPDAIDRQ
jgi:excisionase family DNA binding protein